MLRLRVWCVVALLPLLVGCTSQGAHDCACSDETPVEPVDTAAPG